MRKFVVFLAGILVFFVLGSCSFRINHGLGDLELIKPIDGEKVSRFPTFVWKASDPDRDDKLSWKLYVEPDSSKSILMATGTMNPGLEASWTVPESSPLDKGEFKWYVFVEDMGGATKTSKTASFVTENGTPEVTLMSPKSGENMDTHKVTLSWEMIDPENDKVVARLYVSTSKSKVISMSGITPKYEGTNSSTTLVLDPFKTYYWRVYVKDIYGADDLSDVASFTTGNKAPHVNLLKPTPGSSTDASPTIEWYVKDEDDDALTSYLYLSTNQNLVENESALVYSTKTTGPSNITYKVSNLSSGIYYWKVKVTDGSTSVTKESTFSVEK